MIDTLILSGGGPSGISYIGVFKSLIDNNIIDKELKDIKEIITTSVGIIFSLFLISKINLNDLYKILLNIDFLNLLDINNLTINNLLLEYGLFDNNNVGNYFNIFTKHVYNKENITLKEFYDITNIKLTVKVYNVTLCNIEYISYLNHPNLELEKLARMTTAIPFFFKPIKYNNYLYVDGGTKGNLPIERCNSSKYLAINIKGGISNGFKSDLVPLLEYTKNLILDSFSNENYDEKRNIIININKGINFDLNNDIKKEIIKSGFIQTNNHIKKYFTEN
tara:strand:+ start:375 stop:1208 length:834 start_codon:yes stop_codon:yes gene_type:complete